MEILSPLFAVVVLVVMMMCGEAYGQTTPHIADVFVGRCFERNPKDVNCTDLWSRFSTAAQQSNKAPEQNDTAYLPFFEAASFATPANQLLFWSGNAGLAAALANDGSRFTILEETSTGSILNGLSWCGKAGATPPDFDYTGPCAYLSNTTYFGMQGVWGGASKRFAQGAKGNVTILLQPSKLNFDHGPYMAYRNTSVFYSIELPSINASAVTSIRVLLLANLTQAPLEHCGSGSLLDLEADVQKKFNFTPVCIDEPQQIYEVLCPEDNTASPECIAAMLAAPETTDSTKQDVFFIWALAATVISVLGILAIIYLLTSRRSNPGYKPIG